MTELPNRAHLVTGGFPAGSQAGHDQDFARMKLLELLYEAGAPVMVSSDFADVEKWLPICRMFVTYVAGPMLSESQATFVREWMESGGRWLALHGTSGGKAVRIEGKRQRRMVKTAHHDVLGGFFINHPPVRKFQVDVKDASHPITKGLPPSFEVIDEPYMVQVLDLENSKLLLTAELGPDTSPEGFGFVYDTDTALLPDGKTRAIGYTKDVGAGGVTYFTLGHSHTPATNSQPFVDRSVDPEGKAPLLLRHTWEQPAFGQLLQNAVAWGLRV